MPLLDIPPVAVLQECDGCHDEFGLREIEMTEAGQMLCKKCWENNSPPGGSR